MSTQNLEIGICDDDPGDLERIRDTLFQCLDVLDEKDAAVHLFTNAEALYRESSRLGFGLVFLDVEMPGWNGFELAERLCLEKTGTSVVFISNHESLVFDSYEYTPLWFVRKRFMERDMLRALRKYQHAAVKKRINYRLKDGFGCQEVLVFDMMYIECWGHSLKFWMADQKHYNVYGSLKPVEEELSKYGFIRIHKNYLVNRQYINEVGSRTVQLCDGTELDLSRSKRRELKEIVSRREGRYV
ncbi:response regulator transcription factor [Hungatella sp. L12]|uniref:Stage 0 sporulation protein A homolog n=1 Tax=Hungatella hominis TaxID=2763050 RepID=A0ABR7H6Z2_9FIRM|nr:LytTR family DNA-binding domain-containing protein [Hungatella hominis]MBC5708858.1 response regulator transcription factor [Hungatella hominis]